MSFMREYGRISRPVPRSTSDAPKSYDGLDADDQRAVVDHAVEYASGNVHTNTMENFGSLVKRQLQVTASGRALSLVPVP